MELFDEGVNFTDGTTQGRDKTGKSSLTAIEHGT